MSIEGTSRICRVLAGVRSRWQHALPHCGQPGCGWMRGLRRRLRWWNAGVQMQGQFFCAPQCFELAARQSFVRLLANPSPVQTVRHRIPLGLVMLSRGQLTNRQLRLALEAQQDDRNRRLGEWLEKLGFATEQQVTAALGLQWACPVLADSSKRDRDCARLLPYRLLESFRMLPIQFVEATRTFYFAFSEGIDYPALYAVEQMLDCRAEACLLSRRALDAALEQIAREAGRRDLLFEGWRDASEMARITASYVLKLGMKEARMAGCGDYIWVRLRLGQEGTNLLFRRPAVAADEECESGDHPRRMSG